MSGSWVPQGITDYHPVDLDDAFVTHLKTELKAKKIKLNDEFIERLEHEIAFYRGMKNISSETKPAIVRKNLQKLKRHLCKVIDTLDSLDDLSTSLLIRNLPDGLENARDDLQILMNALDAAEETTRGYPKVGKNTDYASLLLALGIGRAFQDVLQMQPTSSQDGPFESVLVIVFSYVENREATNLADLALKVVKLLKDDS